MKWRRFGFALARNVEAARGFEVLAASPLVHGRALAPHLSFVAHLNVLAEALLRIESGAWGPDIAGRARAALEHIPRYDHSIRNHVPEFLGRPLTDTPRILNQDRHPRGTSALRKLVQRCARLT